MSATFSMRSRSQVEEIRKSLGQENGAAARAFLAHVETIAELIADHPELGRRISPREVRAFPVCPYPYLIYYRVRQNVEILRVMDGARRPPRFHEAALAFRR